MRTIHDLIFTKIQRLLDAVLKVHHLLDRPFDLSGIFAVCDVFEKPGNPRDLLAGQHILVVDDNHSDLQYFTHGLYKGGAIVSCVSSGAQAIEACRRVEFDMVVMDVYMDCMNGFETARKLRSAAYQKPIVLQSADFDPQNFDAVTALKCQAYIDKIIGPLQLLAIATFLCEARQ